MLLETIMPLIDGILLSISGKAKNTEDYGWDWKKAWPTWALSLALGLLAHFLGMEYSAVTSDAMIIGSTALVQNIIKAISRRFKR